jgi:hypothetical protein
LRTSKDKLLQKSYLDKLLNNFNKLETSQPVQSHSIIPTTNTNTYDLTRILNKKKKSKPVATILELQLEIKTLKPKLQTLKQS